MIRGIRVGCLFIVSARVPSWRGGPSPAAQRFVREPQRSVRETQGFAREAYVIASCPSKDILYVAVGMAEGDAKRIAHSHTHGRRVTNMCRQRHLVARPDCDSVARWRLRERRVFSPVGLYCYINRLHGTAPLPWLLTCDAVNDI